MYEDVEEESEDEVSADDTCDPLHPAKNRSVTTDNEMMARQYVGELFDRVYD